MPIASKTITTNGRAEANTAPTISKANELTAGLRVRTVVITNQLDHPSLIGTGVFQDSDGNGLMSSTDELIAVLSHQNSAVELQRDNLQLV